jgi:hypothetical protein
MKELKWFYNTTNLFLILGLLFLGIPVVLFIFEHFIYYTPDKVHNINDAVSSYSAGVFATIYGFNRSKRELYDKILLLSIHADRKKLAMHRLLHMIIAIFLISMGVFVYSIVCSELYSLKIPSCIFFYLALNFLLFCSVAGFVFIFRMDITLSKVTRTILILTSLLGSIICSALIQSKVLNIAEFSKTQLTNIYLSLFILFFNCPDVKLQGI